MKGYIYKLGLVLMLLATLVGCKSSKAVKGPTAADIETANIVKNHYALSPNFETMVSRLKVKYDDGKMSQNVGVSLRLEKDKTIWLSASILGISLAKAKITPERVQYYEKISRTYFDGDYQLISKFLGADLTYKQLEAILLGQPINTLDAFAFETKTTPENYIMVPKKQQKLFNLFFYLNPAFTLQQQRISQEAEGRELTVTYSDYEQVQEGMLPNKIALNAVEKNKQTAIDIEYRSLEFNVPVSFPFSIPEGYKKITL